MATRRNILSSGLALMALACTPTPSVKDDHDSGADSDGPDHTGETGDTAGPEDTGTPWEDECFPTQPADAGPFYRENAPARTDLRTLGETGTELRLDLQVRTAADCTVVEGAVVELWHAQQDEIYDMTTDDLHYRTKLVSDDRGRLSIVTLRPPNYGTEDGNLIGAHIHVKIEAEGHLPLFTQLRFVGDDYNGNFPVELQLDPTTADDGAQEAEFVFFLMPA